MKRVRVKPSKQPTHAFAWEKTPGMFTITYYPAYTIDRSATESELYRLARQGVKVVVTRHFPRTADYDLVWERVPDRIRWVERPRPSTPTESAA